MVSYRMAITFINFLLVHNQLILLVRLQKSEKQNETLVTVGFKVIVSWRCVETYNFLVFPPNTKNKKKTMLKSLTKGYLQQLWKVNAKEREFQQQQKNGMLIL